MIASEDVQYFKFDSEGNMFVYEPGARFSGDCHLVSPGDELSLHGRRASPKDNDYVTSQGESVMSTQSQCDGSSSCSEQQVLAVNSR